MSYNKEYYKKNKKRINKKNMEYQRTSQKYREYRREYEAEYREENRVAWNLKSWKSIRRKNGKRINPVTEIDYLLKNMLKDLG